VTFTGRAGSTPALGIPSSLARRVFGRHHGMDAAAHVEVGHDLHPPRLGRRDEIVENLVGDGFVERADVAYDHM